MPAEKDVWFGNTDRDNDSPADVFSVNTNILDLSLTFDPNFKEPDSLSAHKYTPMHTGYDLYCRFTYFQVVVFRLQLILMHYYNLMSKS